MTTVHGPRRTLSISIVLAALSAVFLDYWEYSRTFHADPGIWSSILDGTAAAPAQYRVGVLKAAEFLTLHSPLAMRHALAVIDLASLLIAAFVLRSLLTRSETWRSASLASQWFGAAAFLLLLEYSLQWLTWYQRPETLTVAALLALSLWLSTHRLPIAGVAGNLLTGFCLVCLGVLQGLTRADAGDLALHTSLLGWNLCGTYDFVNALSPARHFLLASPASSARVCAAAGGRAEDMPAGLARLLLPSPAASQP